ncbi:MAG: hypothetical protein KBD37_06210 [Burkholderiales bacterium]|nr:hypothetical protein [Burkholderiales bacterium]
MMGKKNIILISALALLMVVSGCNAGNDSTSSTSQSISAEITGGSCTNMQTGDTCEITITYNTNGESNVYLNYDPQPLPTSLTNNGSFNSTFGDCQNTVGSTSGQLTCDPVIITYTSAGGSGTNVDLTFTLGDATSNAINVTGD